MSSGDPTDNLKDREPEDNTTQPTITAVFRLLRNVEEGQKGLNSRLDEFETRLNSRIDEVETRIDEVEKGLSGRLDALESRLARDFAAIDARFVAFSEEMKIGLLKLSDKLCDRIDRVRLHGEADYEDLLRRLRKLESKAS